MASMIHEMYQKAAWVAYTSHRYDAEVELFVALIALALGGVLAYRGLSRVERRAPGAQVTLERAVAAVDRELAANLELTTMFDQTRQAFVLENGQFAVHGVVLEREVPDAHGVVADLYARLPEAEAAMERRGPANTLRDDDRLIIERWEGDARAAQRTLRDAAGAPPPSEWDRLVARVRASWPRFGSGSPSRDPRSRP